MVAIQRSEVLKIIAKITKRMNRFCAFAAVLVLADLSFLIGRVECRGDDPNPNFADLWDEDLEEISVPEKLVVTSGKVPSFLSVTLSFWRSAAVHSWLPELHAPFHSFGQPVACM